MRDPEMTRRRKWRQLDLYDISKGAPCDRPVDVPSTKPDPQKPSDARSEKSKQQTPP